MMLRREHDQLPEDLQGIDRALHEHRPRLPEDRLQRVVARAKAAVPPSASRPTQRREPFLRSRIAITLTLVLGFALSGTGAGLAVSGLAGDDQQASSGQYGPPTSGVLPGTTNAPDTTLSPGNAVKGEQDSSGPGEETPGGGAVRGQPARQLAADSGGNSTLPFTGWAAIPVVLLGVALLGSGFAMRRAAQRPMG
jgi:hypothetical protein